MKVATSDGNRSVTMFRCIEIWQEAHLFRDPNKTHTGTWKRFLLDVLRDVSGSLHN